ncbi:hypothetical protein [uncultured Brachyspira sp.]|uniref:hypothetical protein n=1 Tax=uncultured Brachyspira sp. TaxID=221953 RepID=UPI00261E4F5E|nr:hypothetical protein [uncultured Brachyspira sp.]
MTILDLNETILSPKKISECKTEEQLILYIKLDLLNQALNKGKYPEYNTITITDEEEKDYTLNIRAINNDNLEDKISIPFYLENIIHPFSTEKENKYELNYNINFENIIISSVLCIQNVNFNGSVYFRNTTLQSTVGFYNSNFNKVLVFSHSNFYKMQQLEFDNIEFNNMLLVGYCEFKCRVEIEKSKFNGISYFIKNTFNHISLFRQCELNNIIGFYISNFQSNLEFINTNMNTIMYFRGSTINKLLFNEIKFNDNNSILSIDNNFIENNYYDRFFNYLLEYEKKEILKDINKNNNEINKMNFYNTRITGKVDLQNIEVKEADFKGSVINGGLINPVNFKVHKFANRESALFLKNEAYARNNAIDALKYKAKEIECHKDDLMKSAKDIIQNKEYPFNKKIKELYKIVGDIASIYLSSLYSDNGQNWIKALFMTILITIICFTVFYIPDLTDSNIIRIYYRNLFPELIKYFIPTDYSLIIKYSASKLNLFLKIFGVLVYFLGKILFWYGSVQTVQAFRKFAKWA